MTTKLASQPGVTSCRLPFRRPY